MARPRVAVLAGPTAVGKTEVALALARELGAEIVNADSLQVYRELDIGTAKPTLAERALVPHHLVDVAGPDEPYDAARYMREGRAVLAGLEGRGVRPLVVGGTGLYIRALLSGLFEAGGRHPGLRQRLWAEAAAGGLAPMFERLRRLDPLAATRLAPGDTYRVLRALEVTEAAGLPISALQAAHSFRDRPYETLKIGLVLPREELYQRINARVAVMIAAGWLEEVRDLLSRYPPEIKPLKALGYRHLVAYLSGRWSLAEALELLRRDTRRYAKRQLTWFRADPEIRWFAPTQGEEILELLRGFFAGPQFSQ